MPKLKVPGEEHQPSPPSEIVPAQLSKEEHCASPGPKKAVNSTPCSSGDQSGNEEGLKIFYAIFGESDEEVTQPVSVCVRYRLCMRRVDADRYFCFVGGIRRIPTVRT